MDCTERHGDRPKLDSVLTAMAFLPVGRHAVYADWTADSRLTDDATASGRRRNGGKAAEPPLLHHTGTAENRLYRLCQSHNAPGSRRVRPD